MRLLIVEDDLDGREMLAELFRLHDWEVAAVPSTEEALDALRGGAFDVVVSDEDLLGQSGSKMLRAAEAEGLLSDVGVIMYTAEPVLLDAPQGATLLQKPLGISSILAAAQAARPDGRKSEPPPESGERLRLRTAQLWELDSDATSSSRALCDAHAHAHAPPSSRAR